MYFNKIKTYGNKVNIVNNKVNLLSYPWWLAGGINSSNCIAAYQPKGANSLVDSYINLANPGTYDAAPGTAPTWDTTNGWKFAAASEQFLTTGIVPVAGMSWLLRFTNYTNDGSAFGGASENDYSDITFSRTVQSKMMTSYGDGTANTTPFVELGVFGCAGNQPYRNGVADGAAIADNGNSWSESSYGIYIGDQNWMDSNSTLWADIYIQAFAVYNTILTPIQMLALTNVVNTI